MVILTSFNGGGYASQHLSVRQQKLKAVDFTENVHNTNA